jgi:TonB family protein
MPDWMRALSIAGLLCLSLARGFCQSASSLEHYRRGEAYLQENNYQSAANEFREALNGDQEPKWTTAWSHMELGRIFDLTGQHDRAANEYRQAGQAIYLLRGSGVVPIQKTDPEYTDEARLAELEGTVVLSGVIDAEGFARNVEVVEPLGLGLDQNAIEAVKQWHFAPNVSQPQSVTSYIAVDFRLAAKQSRWHLIEVQFNTPPGTSRPVFAKALYPIGAGIGPEAMEEGRVLVAIGRLATAKLRFDVDEHGIPVHFQVINSSETVWGGEATAQVSQWRFTPGLKNGIAVPVSCTVELVWGERNLDFSNLSQVRQVLNEPMDKAPEVISDPTAEPRAIETTRIRVDEQTQAAKLVVKIPPEYPAAARANGLRGTVRLQVLIGIDGRVRQADVMSGDSGLGDTAAEAVKQWVYQPTLLNGMPVEVTTEVTVNYVGAP